MKNLLCCFCAALLCTGALLAQDVAVIPLTHDTEAAGPAVASDAFLGSVDPDNPELAAYLGESDPVGELRGGGDTGECQAGGCTNFGSQYPSSTQSTTSNSFVTISTCMYGSDYAKCNVTAGETYEWSMCTADGGVTAFDAQLTLSQDVSPYTPICYSNDFCVGYSGGTNAPKIQWTATFTGVARVLVSKYNCTSGSSCNTLRWRCVSCVVVAACCFADGSCTLLAQTPCLVQGGNWKGAGTTCSPNTCQQPCVTCPGNGVQEGEPGPLTAGYVDNFNGGCNSASPVFSPITPGVPVCGTSGTFRQNPDGSGNDMRDTDWYQFTSSGDAKFTWSVTAEFPVLIYVINGTYGCPGAGVISATGTTACPTTPTTVTTPCLPAGTYWFFVAPSAFTGVPCGAKYVATLTLAECSGACCLYNGTCVPDQTPTQCAAANGTYHGSGSSCSSIYYSTSTGSAFEDISAAGTHVTAAEVDDNGGSIPIGFTFSFYGAAYTSVFVESNGFLSPGATTHASGYGAPIPTAATPNNLIAVLWRDLNALPGVTPTPAVQYQLLGTSPDQRLVVQWTNVPAYSSPQVAQNNTFQAVLYEATGCVELRYSSVLTTGYRAGVENATGTVGTEVSWLVAPGASIRLCPNPAVVCPAYGACCFPDETCQVMLQAQCVSPGIWQGAGSVCDPNPCQLPSGACCFPDGYCTELKEPVCMSQGGSSWLLGGTCDPNPCPQPDIACCFQDGSCQEMTAALCTQQGGTPKPYPSTCTPNTCPQPGNDCTNPIIIGALPYINTNTTCGRLNDYSNTCLGSYDGGEDIIYKLVVSEPICIDVTVTGATSSDNWIGVLVDDSCPPDPTTCLAIATTSGTVAHLAVDLPAAGAYYLMIDTYPAPNCINFTLAIVPCPVGACCLGTGECVPNLTQARCTTAGGAEWHVGVDCLPVNPCPQPPLNDDCPTAIAVIEGTPAATGNNCLASATDWAEASCQSNSNKDVWYAYTASCTGAVVVDTEGSSQSDTVLSVYASCSGPEIACDDDSGTGNLSSLTFAATAGTTYYIRVASYSAGCGGFNLNITHAPCGACCYADYTCALATEAACTGTWLGADVPCTQCPPPPQTGACCYSDYTCALTTEAGCTGIWLGADVPCSQCPPPPPTGACCYPDYTCAVTTEAICTGIWLGADVPCTQCPPPPQTGACCYADYTCAVTTQLECTGMWLGANVPCEQCPPAPSVCAGDLNCDGSINFRDINPFVLHLSNFSAWQATYPGCPAANGDTNGDGTWSSFRDINPFVALLSAQPPPQCP